MKIANKQQPFIELLATMQDRELFLVPTGNTFEIMQKRGNHCAISVNPDRLTYAQLRDMIYTFDAIGACEYCGQSPTRCQCADIEGWQIARETGAMYCHDQELADYCDTLAAVEAATGRGL